MNCTKCTSAFKITPEDEAFYKKIDVLHPKLCPDCRQQRRLSFRNERKLYKSTCALCQKSMISIFSPDKPYPVYCTECFWGDKWDPMSYGRDFDFGRPFFEQFKELWDDVPKLSLFTLGDNINSDYTHDNYKLKNCYLTFDGEQAEDCYYGETFILIKNCADFLFLQHSELCYECTNCSHCHRLNFSRFCKNCSNSAFLLDCISCKDCTACVNLHQKQFHIFNEPYTEDEYRNKIASFGLNNYENLKKFKQEFEKFCLKYPKKACRGILNENVSGDNINECKDTFESFDCHSLRDCKFCSNMLLDAKDCYDVNIWGDALALAYNCVCTGAGSQNIIASYYVAMDVTDMYHSAFCTRGCSNVLGSVGLTHKKYCIFNKQYNKEEYEILFNKIKQYMQETGEWGVFFPPQLSGYGYNETVAEEYYPLTKEEALKQGFKWSNYKPPKLDVDKFISAHMLPEKIEDIPDDILNWAIECEVTKKPFRLIKAELTFYRNIKLPVPRKHPDQRHIDRMKIRNPRKLWSRTCDKCKKDIQTTYAPGREEIVYCEECYLREVY